jgi:hypothetical protein
MANTASVVRIARGLKDKTNLYVQTKSGNVYRHTKKMNRNQQIQVADRLKETNHAITLKFWVKVK